MFCFVVSSCFGLGLWGSGNPHHVHSVHQIIDQPQRGAEDAFELRGVEVHVVAVGFAQAVGDVGVILFEEVQVRLVLGHVVFDGGMVHEGVWRGEG